MSLLGEAARFEPIIRGYSGPISLSSSPRRPSRAMSSRRECCHLRASLPGLLQRWVQPEPAWRVRHALLP